MRPPPRDAVLAGIARGQLGIETLDTRQSDGLDFHTVAVWSVRAALEAAYEAGARVGPEVAPRPGKPSRVAFQALVLARWPTATVLPHARGLLVSAGPSDPPALVGFAFKHGLEAGHRGPRAVLVSGFPRRPR